MDHRATQQSTGETVQMQKHVERIIHILMPFVLFKMISDRCRTWEFKDLLSSHRSNHSEGNGHTNSGKSQFTEVLHF